MRTYLDNGIFRARFFQQELLWPAIRLKRFGLDRDFCSESILFNIGF